MSTGRKVKSAPLAVTLAVACSLVAQGCMSWKAPWQARAARVPRGPAVSVADAERVSAAATDAAGVRAALEAYEAVLAAQPDHTGALVESADLSVLLATAYTDGRRAKRRLYRRAQAFAELAMYENPGFQALADEGQPPWQACTALEQDDMRAMLIWMTALLYNFKECMSVPARIVNIRWIKRLGPFLERMEAIDPDWQDGVVPFNWGFYYFVLPKSLGGDRPRAAEEFERAVAQGNDRLLYRWGRARFFRVRTKDRDGFREDLEWVLEQDLEAVRDPARWAHYIQRDARRLLDDIERYF